MTPQERIKADAEQFSYMGMFNSKPLRNDDELTGYIAGATAEARLSKRLLDTLEQIVHAPVPANEREYISWFITAKNIAGGAISAYEAENEALQWKGKEPQPVEYMPIHPEDAKKSDCPKQFPMHLLDEGQAQRNHSQSLKRLKERGGLSVREILAIVGKKPWSYYGNLPWDEAIKTLNDIILTNPQK